jgi:hypothetical protein
MRALVSTLGICAMALFAVGGCGSDDEEDPKGTGGSSGSGGSTGGSGGSTGGSGGSTGGSGGSTGGSGGTAGAATGGTAGAATGGTAGAAGAGSGLSCASFCALNLATCVGPNEQYDDNNDCMTECATWAAGSSTDTAGDTLGCRTYHLGVAAQPGNAGEHCPHTGPDGGGVCA